MSLPLQPVSSDVGADAAPAIGVFGHYGNRNLGDEAIIEAVVQRMRGRLPAARLVLFSIHPRDTRSRYGVEAYPLRRAGEVELRSPAVLAARPTGAVESPLTVADAIARRGPLASLLRLSWRALRLLVKLPIDGARELAFLRRCYRRVRGLDAMLIAGSNQFLDNYGGTWGFPYTLLKWTVICRMAGVRVYFASVGAGPLDSALSRAMVRLCLPFADYVSFRDEGSRRLVEGVRVRRAVFPDLAHSLPLGESLSGPPPTAPLAVAINPAPVQDSRYWFESDAAKYRAYVAELAAFADRLLAAGHEVSFFPTHPKDIEVARDILAAMRSHGGPEQPSPPIRRPETVADLMQIISEADIIVPTRFHGVVLSLHAWKPVLAICYYRKTRELMRGAGQEAYAIDVGELRSEQLWERFKALEARRDLERQHIRSVESAWRHALEQQYAELCARIAATCAPGSALSAQQTGTS